MSAEALASKESVAESLRSGIRKGQEPAVPYARKWEVGGCSPIHSLRTYPYDGVGVLSEGLLRLRVTIRSAVDGVVIEGPSGSVWVAVNRSIRGEGPPDAYLIGAFGERRASYAGNAPEVVIALLEGIWDPAPAMPTDSELQVGFPGLPGEGVTYVGSWQWGIHGEARKDDFVPRAAAATAKVILTRRELDA